LRPWPREIFVQCKKPKRRVAALRAAAGDVAVCKKIRGNDAIMFGSSIRYRICIYVSTPAISKKGNAGKTKLCFPGIAFLRKYFDGLRLSLNRLRDNPV